MDQPARFEDHFWGEGLKGFDILLQNHKASVNASKELMDYLKERAGLEETYVKSLQRMHKTLLQVTEPAVGCFYPVWAVMVASLEDMCGVHHELEQTMLALHKEVEEYHQTQKERQKAELKGEIDGARECYLTFENLGNTVQKTKKTYKHCAHEVAVLKNEIPLAPAKSKEKLEDKAKKMDVRLQDAREEHKEAVSQHCKLVMDTQGKMKEAFQKFQSLEEEHLQQLLLFTTKYTSAFDYYHRQLGETHTNMCAKMNSLPVQLLISQFALKKATGMERPGPHLFKEINISELATNLAQNEQQGKGKSKKLFDRRNTASRPSSRDTAQPAAAAGGSPDKRPPEVDEEGYSIRPADASEIKFDDDEQKQWSSDSDDDEDQPRNKFKNLTIKGKEAVKTATADELMSIKLAVPTLGTGPSVSKASSSGSINRVGLPKSKSALSSGSDLSGSRLETSSVDILDIDFGGSAAGPPATSASTVTTSGNVDLLAGPNTLPSPLSPITITPSLSSNTSATSVSAQPPKEELGFSADFSIPNHQQPPPKEAPEGTSSSTPTARPRQNSVNAQMKELDAALSGMLQSSSELETDGSSVTNTPSDTQKASRPPQAVEQFATSLASTTTVPPQQAPPPTAQPIIALPRPPQYASGRRRQKGGGTPGQSDSPLITLKSPSPTQPPSFPGNGEAASPVPSKRTTVGVHLGGTESPQMPRPPSRSSLTSNSSGNAPSEYLTPPSGSSTPPIQAKATDAPPTEAGPQSAPTVVVPIAAAFIETVNVIFKGNRENSPLQSLTKVTGELALSFPSAHIGMLASHKQLQFTLEGRVERLSSIHHNTLFLNKLSEGPHTVYTFDMTKLHGNLLQKVAESPSAAYHNLLVLKYEVSTPVESLPVQLDYLWKANGTQSKATVVYKYNTDSPLALSDTSSLTNVLFSAAMEGAVEKVSMEPTGNWSAEHKKAMWTVPVIAKGDTGTLTATVEHSPADSLTPQTAQLKFTHDGSTLSGLQLSVKSNSYRISLLKQKLSSGRYEAEPQVEG